MVSNSEEINLLLSLLDQTKQIRPVLLFGAGASKSSGIPLSADAVTLIAKEAYKRNRTPMSQSDLLGDAIAYLNGLEWAKGKPKEELFPLAVHHLLTPREFRKQVLYSIISRATQPNTGYLGLAQLMRRGLIKTVLTTNFDEMIRAAVISLGPISSMMTDIRCVPDLVKFNIHNSYQVIHLHGALEYYNDKNAPDELDKLDEEIIRRVRPMLIDQPLVVVGYRGAEDSIMSNLLGGGIHDSQSYRHGIYWCVMHNEEPHQKVKQFAEAIGDNFHYVRIESFDVLFSQLAEQLKEHYLMTGEATNLTPGAASTFDRLIESENKWSDIDEDHAYHCVVDYCRNLGLPEIARSSLVPWLTENGYAQIHNDEPVPTNGALLLFGKRPSDRFPFAKILFREQGKKQTVYDGNLLTQLQTLSERILSPEVNPEIRLKRKRSTDEALAYDELSLKEILVNMIVHRDYSLDEYSQVEWYPDKKLVFTNAGGLLPSSRSLLSQGQKVIPKREVSELRNPSIADMFFGLRYMDKAGTGLADAIDGIRANGGEMELSIDDKNIEFKAEVLQPRASATGIARSLAVELTYSTNLLRFLEVPIEIYRIPVFRDIDSKNLWSVSPSPLFIIRQGYMYSFENLDEYPNICELAGGGKMEILATHSESIESKVLELLRRHWETRLREKADDGLRVDWKARHAVFQLIEGMENKISYKAATRKASRAVVKMRPKGDRLEGENEGIAYRILKWSDEFLLQIKPIYIFTREDGKTPLPPSWQGSRATRRFKFDRNVNVADDLQFWARYLADGGRFIDCGHGKIELNLDSQFVSISTPIINK